VDREEEKMVVWEKIVVAEDVEKWRWKGKK
jgi:hypothetical protein